MRRMLPRRTSLAHSSEVAHMEIRRGDIYYADLTPVVGCEQGGRRPVLDGERMAAVDRAILISFGLDGLVGDDGKNAEK